MNGTPPEALSHLDELRALLASVVAPEGRKVTARTPGFVPQLATWEELYGEAPVPLEEEDPK